MQTKISVSSNLGVLKSIASLSSYDKSCNASQITLSSVLKSFPSQANKGQAFIPTHIIIFFFGGMH